MVLVYAPPDEDLCILHEDPLFLIVSKPNGLLSVPGKPEGHKDCLISRLQDAYPGALTVHRLDLDTSGIMVFARDADTHRNLGLQFEHRKVSKTYIARVWGDVEGDEGMVDLPLCVDWPNRPRQHVNHEEGRPSQTQWRVLEREGGITRLELTPITGRSHQLRVHMLSLGHPILGDTLYAHEDAVKAAPRMNLHAQDLSFHHPVGGTIVSFSDPCPF